jgi:hypothetical protein
MNSGPTTTARPSAARRLFLSIGFGFLFLLPGPLHPAAEAATIVLSFTNTSLITITDAYSQGTLIPSQSTIQVPALPGALQSVAITLNDFSAPGPVYIEMMLVGPSGQAAELMCNAGDYTNLTTNAIITIADSGQLFPTTGAIPSGTYQPSDFNSDSGNQFPFYSPFYSEVTTNQLAGFIGTTLTGAWNLEVYCDGETGTNGSITGGWSLVFSLLAPPPSVTTLTASDVTTTNAILNASVVPNGSPASVFFEYGPTTNYGNFSATNTLTNDLADAQAVAQTLTNLLPGTTNHFQAVVQNSVGTNFGGDKVVVTLFPTMLEESLANGHPVLTLYGNPGSNYLIVFTTNLSSPVSWTVLTNLTLAAPVLVIPLSPPASQAQFVYLATVPPTVTTLPAASITSSNAVLNATVQPNYGPASVFFEYGPTTNYGYFSATNTLTGDLGDAQTVAQAIAGLSPGTTNFFQAVVQNGLGTNFGGPLSFLTLSAPPTLGTSLTNGSKPVLILSGAVGLNYNILSATNLSTPVTWSVFTNLTLTNALQFILPGPSTNPVEFFRAEQLP